MAKNHSKSNNLTQKSANENIIYGALLACSLIMMPFDNALSGDNSIKKPVVKNNKEIVQLNNGNIMGEKLSNLVFSASSKELTQIYNDENGAGIDNFGTDSLNQNTENAFSVKLPEGDYKVNLILYTENKTAKTIVYSEDRRVMGDVLTLKKNKPLSISFYVNVKTPAIKSSEQDADNSPKVGLRGDEFISRNWDNRLTIATSTKDAKFRSIEISKVNMPKILIAGDSTVADQAGGDYASWGQFIPTFITDRPIINHARSGETLKSYLFSLRWDKLLSQVRDGDIVLIQFGHNDEKAQWPRTYAAYDGAYPKYLAAFAADVKQRGGIPILISPVARLRIGADGKNENTHKGYDTAVAQTARDMNIGFIDLTNETTIFYEALGKAQADKAFGDNGKDKTHHNYYGAYYIANIVANNLSALYPAIIPEPSLKFDPAKPISPNNFQITPDLWPDMRPKIAPPLGHEPIVKTNQTTK